VNRRQIQACVSRMPASESLAFLALIQASDELFARSVALRGQAWRLFHDTAVDAPAAQKSPPAGTKQQRKGQS